MVGNACVTRLHDCPSLVLNHPLSAGEMLQIPLHRMETNKQKIKTVQQFLFAYTDEEEQKHMPEIYSDFSFSMNELKGVHLQVKPRQLC